MATHKRAKKKRKEMSVAQAVDHLIANTFRDLSNPSQSLMYSLICSDPMTIARMPQANVTLQMTALRLDGSLLYFDISWGFDTEKKFPGSTVWNERHGLQFSIDINRAKAGDEVDAVRKKLMVAWEPIRLLSTWPSSSIYEHERGLLINGTYESNLALIECLLQSGPDRKRNQAVYPDMSASLNSCLAADLE